MKTPTILYPVLLAIGLLSLCGMAAAQEAASSSGTLLTDDIQPYIGPIGPESPLYGLKLAFEDIGESFTANQTERIDLQIAHAELRIAEAKKELADGRDDMAQEALGGYWQKMNLTNESIANWTGNATGLLHAQEEIVKHQFVLEHLLETHPGNRGLLQAYNNSRELEAWFSNRTAFWFNRTLGKDNETFLWLEFGGGNGRGREGWLRMNMTGNRTPPNGTSFNGTPPAGDYGWPGINMTGNRTSASGTLSVDHSSGHGLNVTANRTTPARTPTADHQSQNSQHGGQQTGSNDNAEKGRGSSRGK